MHPKIYFKECLPIFNALGDTMRQKILFLIGDEQNLSVSEIAERVTLSRPAVSHHLSILHAAGIISHRKTGRESIYYLSFEDALTKMSKLIQSVEAGTKKD